jgi:hypothetical protein
MSKEKHLVVLASQSMYDYSIAFARNPSIPALTESMLGENRESRFQVREKRRAACHLIIAIASREGDRGMDDHAVDVTFSDELTP